jgi:E3 ubiquitin-protein ligase HUWE1
LDGSVHVSPCSDLQLTGDRQFLEGFFQHHLHCDDFVKKIDGLDRLERITALSCLPYDFANSPSSDSLVQVARTLAEANPKETLLFLSRMVQKSLAETSDFWSTVGGGSKLGPLLEFAGMSIVLFHTSAILTLTQMTRRRP